MAGRDLKPIERRIWRLAFLLTGDPDAAADLIARVLHSRPDPTALDAARLDRLIVLRSREIAPGASRSVPGAPEDAARALHAALSMPPQPLEAWVLTRVDLLDELHVSRAMDCSRTAAGNHLASADARMKTLLADRLDAGVSALRAYADSLNPAPLIAQARARARARRKRRAAVTLGVGAIALLAAAWVVLTFLA